jgi:hypothetical protein
LSLSDRLFERLIRRVVTFVQGLGTLFSRVTGMTIIIGPVTLRKPTSPPVEVELPEDPVALSDEFP